MATLTVTPHTNDAGLRKTGASFAAARGGTTASSIVSASATTLTAQVDNASDGSTWVFDRAVLPFDTSGLGAGATVTAATLDLNVTALYSAEGTCYLDLVGVSLASAPTVATTDWQYISMGTALATRISFSTTGVKTFTLNAAGLAALNKTGFTTFAVVVGNDYSNNESSPNELVGYPYGVYTYVTFNTADAGSNRPTLTVTYTPAPAPSASTVRRRPRGLYTR